MITEFMITDGGNILKKDLHKLHLGKHPFTFSLCFLY